MKKWLFAVALILIASPAFACDRPGLRDRPGAALFRIVTAPARVAVRVAAVPVRVAARTTAAVTRVAIAPAVIVVRAASSTSISPPVALPKK